MRDEKKTRLYIIIGFAVLSAIIVGVIGLIYGLTTKNASEQPDMHQFTDPGSGNVILSPDGKAPEKVGVNPEAPIYIGFDKLLDVGLAFDQVTSIKSALSDYAFQVKNQTKITEISLTAGSIKNTPNPNGPDTYLFTIVLNRKDQYKVIITTNDITSIQLSLYTKDGRDPIFTSQK